MSKETTSENGRSSETLDKDENTKLINLMKKTLKAQSRLLMAYRMGCCPPEWVFDMLKKARKAGLEI